MLEAEEQCSGPRRAVRRSPRLGFCTAASRAAPTTGHPTLAVMCLVVALSIFDHSDKTPQPVGRQLSSRKCTVAIFFKFTLNEQMRYLGVEVPNDGMLPKVPYCSGGGRKLCSLKLPFHSLARDGKPVRLLYQNPTVFVMLPYLKRDSTMLRRQNEVAGRVNPGPKEP